MANPTTNYGWPMPTSTDLVTDLPADFAAFGQPVDTSLKALNPETTLGDISYRSATANTNTRLAIGSTGNVLTVSGGVPVWAAPAGGGKVLQVVQATYSTSTGTTSTSYVDSGLSASITPSATSSKIMVIATLPMKGSASIGGDIQGGFQLVRGATAVQAVPYAFSIYQGASQWKFMQTLSYLDSPSTTSATTYKIQITALGGSSSTITAQSENNTSVILLIEIGA